MVLVIVIVNGVQDTMLAECVYVWFLANAELNPMIIEI